MKQVQKIFFISFAAIFLAGCATEKPPKFSSQTLGISEQEWMNYDQEKQQKTLAAYETIYQQKMEENPPIIQDKKNKKKQPPVAQSNEIIPLPPYLAINVRDGRAKLPPYTDWSAYQPIDLIVSKGSCSETNILPIPDESAINNKTADKKPKTEFFSSLRVCYKNKTLFFDSSRYDLSKKDYSITFAYSPLWQQGFTYYNINSSGQAHFKNATVKIKQVDLSKL